MGWRLEIEGMRAIAVLAVMLFHLGFKFLPGGFLGVDVFFVISGFLITGIIIRDVELDRFSLLNFYGRRALRLLPAAGVVIVATVLAGFSVLPPDQLDDLSKSAIAALTIASNVYFWNSVSYFDVSANLKPLLHTWSLGVEQQFYLAWPIVLVTALKLVGAKAWRLVAVMALVSVALAQLFVVRHPSMVFYLMPFRIFELAIGGCLAFIPRDKANHVPSWLGWSGFAVLIICFVAIDASVRMPAAYSLIPCAATAAMIMGGHKGALKSLIGSKPLVFIGRISYSLYLVHWPIILLAPTTNAAIIFVACFACAIPLYYLVEQPFDAGKVGRRAAHLIGWKTATGMCVGVSVVGIVLSVYAISTDGLRSRMANALDSIPSAGQMWGARNPTVRVGKCFLTSELTIADFDKIECLSREENKKNVLIVGDSFAGDLYSAMVQAFPKVHFLQATSGNCAPYIGNAWDQNCIDILHLIFDEFSQNNKLDAIILGGNWVPDDAAKAVDTVAKLAARGTKIILAGPPVRFGKNVPDLIFESKAKSADDAEAYVLKQRSSYDAVNETLKKRLPSEAEFIDVAGAMCAPKCRIFSPDAKLMFLDFGHLTVDGAAFLSKNLKALYANLL